MSSPFILYVNMAESTGFNDIALACVITKAMSPLRLYWTAGAFMTVELCSHRTIRVADCRTHSFVREGDDRDGAHALKEIVRFDRRWFRAHPERRHRCRWPHTGELDLCDCDGGARLVVTMRHLGRGSIIYQPVIFQGCRAGTRDRPRRCLRSQPNLPSRFLSLRKRTCCDCDAGCVVLKGRCTGVFVSATES
jgi:hypothetical protein